MTKVLTEQDLKCPICYLIAEEPHETSCCGHLFCEECIKGIQYKPCPICRKFSFVFQENTFIKELFKKVKIDCPSGCDIKVAISDLRLHRYECEAAVFKCSIDNCNYEGKKSDATTHCLEKHGDYMIMMLEDYKSIKNIFDKHSLYDKLQAKSKNKFIGFNNFYNIK
jgi:hypothetical protein